MFDKCPFNSNETCPFATIKDGILYCGFIYGNNKVKDLKKCPLKEKKKKIQSKFY